MLRCELRFDYHDNVTLTREKDEFVTLSDRIFLANVNYADLFISIHCDAWHNTTVQGISTHIYHNAGEQTVEIANNIHHALIDAFPDHINRGIKRSNFHVLRETKMSAVLIECEFLSNPVTRRFLKEPHNQLDIAKAIARGVS